MKKLDIKFKFEVPRKTVIIATDGACSMNKTWTGGWSFVVLNSKRSMFIKSGSELKTTNNRMELMAILEALKSIVDYERKNKKKLRNIILVSDSGYSTFPFIKYGWIEKWKRNQIKKTTLNYDLWCEIIPLVIKLSQHERIKIYQIRGHGKDKKCDYVKRDCATCRSYGCTNPLFQTLNSIVDEHAVNARLRKDGLI